MAQLFHPGDTVMLFYGFSDRRGSSTYEVVRALPASEQDEPQYQVRGPEGYDRVISEGQIRLRVKNPEALASIQPEDARRRQPTLSQLRPSRAVSLAHSH